MLAVTSPSFCVRVQLSTRCLSQNASGRSTMMAAASAPIVTPTCRIQARAVRQELRVASSTTASPLRRVSGLETDGLKVMTHSAATESQGSTRETAVRWAERKASAITEPKERRCNMRTTNYIETLSMTLKMIRFIGDGIYRWNPHKGIPYLCWCMALFSADRNVL